MKIKIVGEHNFFLFQDIVYYFMLTLEHEWRFPIESIHYDKDYKTHSSLYDIYKSWYELLLEKINTFELNEYGKRVLEQRIPWMVTTNIAITKSQMARGREGIPSWEIEYTNKYKPFFLIDFDLNNDTYVACFDGEMANSFKEALIFRNAFHDLTKESFISVLKRYYTFDESLIEQEVEKICEHYQFDDDNINSFSDYEVLEE